MWEALALIKTVVEWIGWLGLGAVPVAIAAVVIWLNPRLLKPAIIAAALWASHFAVYTWGDSHGADRVQERWDAAREAAVERGRGSRERAEREIPPAEPAPEPEPQACPGPPGGAPAVRRAPRPVPQWMRDDPRNRDNRR